MCRDAGQPQALLKHGDAVVCCRAVVCVMSVSGELSGRWCWARRACCAHGNEYSHACCSACAHLGFQGRQIGLQLILQGCQWHLHPQRAMLCIYLPACPVVVSQRIKDGILLPGANSFSGCANVRMVKVLNKCVCMFG